MNRLRNPFILARSLGFQSTRLITRSTTITKTFSTSSIRRSPNEDLKVLTEEEASQSALLVALHKRLELPKEFKLSTLARCLTCRSSQNKLVDNYGLNILGKNLLSYYVSEHLLVQYPRLPTVILNTAINSYISAESLASIGEHAWGIEVDSTSSLQKYLSEEPIEYSYGKLRFVPVNSQSEKGVTKLSGGKHEYETKTAYGLATRSIIGALYASTKSEQATKKFINDHILSRKLDVSRMFEFEQPTRELSRLCKREGFEVPIARLLAENGRTTKNPVFVVGVFSGKNKLGESFGSSLKEAKIRASVNALKNWYLYKPLDPKVPSDESYKPGLVDHGAVIV